MCSRSRPSPRTASPLSGPEVPVKPEVAPEPRASTGTPSRRSRVRSSRSMRNVNAKADDDRDCDPSLGCSDQQNGAEGCSDSGEHDDNRRFAEREGIPVRNDLHHVVRSQEHCGERNAGFRTQQPLRKNTAGPSNSGASCPAPYAYRLRCRARRVLSRRPMNRTTTATDARHDARRHGVGRPSGPAPSPRGAARTTASPPRSR